MSKLFSPLRLRDLEIRNRVFVSPMCQYSAEQGIANHWHLVHLGSRAAGGAGLVMVEATAVSAEGRISPGCVGLWNDQQADAFVPIARFIQEQGAASGIQIGHAGRKASTDYPWSGGGFLAKSQQGWQTVAPSAIAFAKGYETPVSLNENEIETIVEQFVSAARRALHAGFDVVELHMAHGYLVHQFLSPLTNHRTDRYGGSFENRTRLATTIAQKVRSVWPNEKPLFARLSCTDWVDGGWDIAQSIELSKILRNIGVDLIDCSSGGLTPDAKIPAAPGYQTPFASAIKQQANVATGAVGLITQPAQAEQIVATGLADAVFLAREMLRDPYWALHAAQSLGADITWPKQYLRVKPKL